MMKQEVTGGGPGLVVKVLLACAVCIGGLPCHAQAPINTHQNYINYQTREDNRRRMELQDSSRASSTSSSSGSSWSGRSSYYQGGGGGGDVDFVRFSLYGTHLQPMSSKYDTVDIKGGGMMFQIDYFAASLDFMFGEIERDGVRYGAGGGEDPIGGFLFFADIYLALPPLFALTDIASDGLTFGVGPGLFLGTFADARPYPLRENIDEQGLSLCAYASYKFVIGEIGVRARNMVSK